MTDMLAETPCEAYERGFTDAMKVARADGAMTHAASAQHARIMANSLYISRERDGTAADRLPPDRRTPPRDTPGGPIR